jgi:2-polyprenyl-3-methyl-5-hydroxy-6-metoxy-1,4-benzoquinol methylase
MQQQIEHLMDQNQALKAWDLIKDTNDPLKERVWLKVKHAFDDKAYKDYYMNDLAEYPVEDDIAYDVLRHDARFRWLLPKLMDLFPKSILDIGCADGYLGLTLGRWGIPSTGINLFKPSVELARKRAEINHLPAKFIHGDFRDYQTQHEAVVFFEILEHLPDPAKAIEKAYSLVKDGGRLYISTPRAGDHIGIAGHLANPDRESWDDGKPAGHIQLFSEDEFKELLKPYKVLEFFVDEERSMLCEISKE